MIEIRVIDEQHKKDIDLPNEPFPLFGRMVPSLQDGIWSYNVERFSPEDVTDMRFPDFPYEYDPAGKAAVFLGAYEGEECVGLAVLRDDMFRYMYLDDLKICAACRGQGVGKRLIRAAREIAVNRGHLGLYTIAQDNNLAACLFYLRCGFSIGGFDNRLYRGTSQEDKANILFYIDGLHNLND